MSAPMFGTVERVERLTPHLVRVVFGGPGLGGFGLGEGWTDSYVNLLFTPPDAPYAVPFDVAAARSLERDRWPIPRRYTVRHWDPDQRLLSIDFVVHGDLGTAGAWAQHALPGDRVQFQGPSGAYRPDPSTAWHLMVGDESTLPAIAASLEAVPAGASALVVGLVDSPDDELELACAGECTVVWLHRDTLPDPDGVAAALVEAVAKLEFPADDVHAFVHGEAVETRAVRRHLLGERHMPREALSVSPYWRRTYTDERWREIKRDWLAEVERDV